MATNQTNLGVVISATDRASPVMRNVGRNMQAMGSRALSTSTAIGAQSSSASGVGQAFVPLLGGLGPAAVAITGVSVATAFAVKRFTEMRREAAEVRKAQESLGTTLILSGLSASAATARISELRTSFDRMSFQALPRLSSEMQVFLGTMDDDSRRQVAEWAETLKAAGFEDEKAVIDALGEAMQDNFNPISYLLKQPIDNMEELKAVLARLALETKVSGSDILQIIQQIGDGSLSIEDGVKRLTDAVRDNLPGAAQIFRDEGDTIKTLLKGLNEDELATLITAVNDQMMPALRGMPVEFATQIGNFATTLGTMKTDMATRATEFDTEIGNIILALQGINPEAATMVSDLYEKYKQGDIDLTYFRNEVGRLLGAVRQELLDTGRDGTQAAADFALVAADFEEAANRIVNARNRAAGNPTPTPAGPIPGLPIAPVVPVAPLDRPFQTFEESQRFQTFNPQAPLTIQLGEYDFGQAVIEVVNNEIRIKEPGLGLG